MLRPSKKLLVGLSLLLLLTLSGDVSARPDFRKSVARLGDIHEDGKLHEFCSSWAVRDTVRTVWITAAHCVLTNPDGSLQNLEYRINGQSAKLLKVDWTADLAMFDGPTAPGLTVAFGEPKFRQKVFTFTYFLRHGFYSEGITSVPDEAGRNYFNITAGPGSSGGAIFADGDLVVGIVQNGACPYPCTAVWGSSVKDLRAFIYGE